MEQKFSSTQGHDKKNGIWANGILTETASQKESMMCRLTEKK